jgi:recyclin-1
MLNPQRWGGTTGGGGNGAGYSKTMEKDGRTLFEVEEQEEEEEGEEGQATPRNPNPLNGPTITVSLSDYDITSPTPLVPFSPPSPLSASPSTANLDLLLSLDLALNLIHLSRSSLKRVESFSGYPGHYGTRVRDTVEEVFIALLWTLGERHVVRGFDE